MAQSGRRRRLTQASARLVAPSLNNVTTPYDLLSDARPATFTFGTREFDPVKLGYAENPSQDDTRRDTSLLGNSHQGHWWTDDAARPGRIGPRLTDDDKYALIEYLKAATYENYPREKRASPAATPCQENRDWALKVASPAAK